MQKVRLNQGEHYITLGQFLKYIGQIQTGGEAKYYLSEENVSVNGEHEDRRGKKLYPGDQVTIESVGDYSIDPA